jgi:hypothetical protein
MSAPAAPLLHRALLPSGPLLAFPFVLRRRFAATRPALAVPNALGESRPPQIDLAHLHVHGMT